MYRLSHEVTTLAGQLGTPELPDLVRCFLYQQGNPELLIPLGEVPLDICPTLFGTKVHVYASAIATFFALSDKSSTRGMFESAFKPSIHGGKGHQDMTACLLNKRVILKASAGHLLLEYALFFQSNTRRLYIPVLLYHGIQPLGTSHVPTPRCGKYGLTSTTWVILFWILFI